MDSSSRIEAIDTNVLLRLMLDDDLRGTRKVVKHLMTTDADFIVDDYCLGEIEHVLKKKDYGRELIVSEIKRVLMNPMFIWNKELFRRVFDLYEEHPSLSFNDCYLAIKADDRTALPIWTLDRKFAKQTRQAKLIA